MTRRVQYPHLVTIFGPVFVYPIIKQLVADEDDVVKDIYPKLYPNNSNCCIVCGCENTGRVFQMCDRCIVGN